MILSLLFWLPFFDFLDFLEDLDLFLFLKLCIFFFVDFLDGFLDDFLFILCHLLTPVFVLIISHVEPSLPFFREPTLNSVADCDGPFLILFDIYIYINYKKIYW